MYNPIRFLLVPVLLLGAAAFAQSPARSDIYVGGSVQAGFLFDVCIIFGECGGGSFGVSAHVGAHDLIAKSVGGRASVSATFARNIAHFQLAADALYEPVISGSTVAPYLGGGPRVGMMSRHSSNPNVNMVSGITFGVGVLGGARFAVSEQLAAFVEAGVDLVSTSGWVPSVAVGVDFGF